MATSPESGLNSFAETNSERNSIEFGRSALHIGEVRTQPRERLK